MSERITFTSDGLRLAGLVDLPKNLKSGERRPAIIALHGFGSNKDNTQGAWAAETFTGWGYVVLRIDFRGCGESEGERGRVICLEQVTDTLNALGYLATRREVDERRIALLGTSLGAAVALYAAGADPRPAAVLSQGGWGHGERKFRRQHATSEKWDRFMAMIAEGIRQRERTGKSLMVPRYEIVPIPQKLRTHLSGNSVMEFPAETALSLLLFQPDEMIGKIAPRPVMLLHAADDSVTPTMESIELFQRAKPPAELHLIDGADHFMFAEGNQRVVTLVRDWLKRYFPAAT